MQLQRAKLSKSSNVEGTWDDGVVRGVAGEFLGSVVRFHNVRTMRRHLDVCFSLAAPFRPAGKLTLSSHAALQHREREYGNEPTAPRGGPTNAQCIIA